jgi:peptidoglycan/LPS O-acetylase OafA/YrhL
MGYRPDIDGLRALAVLSVIAYHWQIPPFRGGFVGVDIFFTISGFLITQIITTEVDQQRFSFWNFYERRIRRILPALYVMIAAVFVLSWSMLFPSDYRNLSSSILSVVTFRSNFFFWREAGYFDTSSLGKPLLHTWSLAVEEQFYLVLPVLIWVIAKVRWHGSVARGRLLTLGVVGALSFGISMWGVFKSPHATFYLPFGRAWEFLLGSALTFDIIPSPHNTKARVQIAFLGLCVLGTSIFTITDHSLFPGPGAVLPCLGCALIILAQSNRIASVSRTAPFHALTFIGKISYPLYLWHWPAYIYALAWLGGSLPLKATEKIILFIATLVLAYFSFQLVEQPIRRKWILVRQPALFAAAICASTFLLAAGAAGVFYHGFPNRFDSLVANIDRYSNYARQSLYREGTCFIQPQQTVLDYPEPSCFAMSAQKPNVLLWGDSLAAHFYGALAAKLPDANILQATASACLPIPSATGDGPSCHDFNARIFDLIKEHHPDTVILSAQWMAPPGASGYEYLSKLLHNTAATLNDLAIKVIILGPGARYKEPLPKVLDKVILEGTEQQLTLNSKANDFLVPGLFDLDQRMSTDFANSQNVLYVSILNAICVERVCPVFVNNSVPIGWDTIHLTAEGSLFVVDRILPLIAAEIAAK